LRVINSQTESLGEDYAVCQRPSATDTFQRADNNWFAHDGSGFLILVSTVRRSQLSTCSITSPSLVSLTRGLWS